MARIALITTGIVSHLHAGFELSRRLQSGGHETCFFTGLPQGAGRVESQGFRVFRPPASNDAADPRGGRRARARARLESLLDPAALQSFLREFRPELVLVQSEMHATILWLLGSGIRPAVLEADSVRRMAGVPPPDSGYIAAGRWFDRPVCAALWFGMRWRRRLRHWLRRLALRGLDPVSRWRKVAAAAGVDLDAVATRDQWPVLYYPDLPYLCLAAVETDFPAGRRATAGRIGPMVFRARREPDRPEVAEVRQLLSARGNAARPLVLCAMGSILHLPSFYRRIVTAARDADFDLLLAGRDAGMDLPANVFRFDYIPQIETLAAVDAVVCHGGNATVNECIDAGVPMLVCSAGLMDEDGLAARVAFHGLGLRAGLRASAATLRRALETLLGDDAYRQRVAAMRAAVAHYESDNVALARIDELLQR